MSFGLLTVINFEDIPIMLRVCARGYRRAVTLRYPTIWQIIADEFDAFASRLETRIEEAKQTEPKTSRDRVRL